MLIATIVARNYLAQARILARSFRAHHPDGHVAVLITDGRGSGIRTDEPFEVLTPDALPIEPAEFRRMATIYDVTELATAVKPWLLLHLLERGEPAVTYLDPDIEVFAPLDDIDELARQHSMVLTPHRLDPTPSDRLEPTEQALLQSGAYNLGFIAVSPAARPFLEWWSEHCRRDCIVDFSHGLFVDQRWIDLAVTYYDPKILRDRGCNVAYWNLDERPVTSRDGRYAAGDAPLRFFHYSGFDPTRPHVMTRFQSGRPRVRLSQEPALRALFDGYARKLEQEGSAQCRTLTYGFERAANGMEIDFIARRVFAEEIRWRERGHAADPGSIDELGSPFAPDDVDAFVATLRSPNPRTGYPRVSRYLVALHSVRDDLRHSFPELSGLEGNHFMWWVKEMGYRELGIPTELVPTDDDLEPVDHAPGPLSPGVRVVGYLAAELGVGEHGRAMVAVLDALGEPYLEVYERNTASRQRHVDTPGAAGASGNDFDVNLVCVNADRLAGVLDRLGRSFTSGRHTVGFWAWEVEEFPAWMAQAQDMVDEIWTPSVHTTRAISAAVDKPVHTFPNPVVDRASSGRDRRALGLPEGFLFLFCFDVFSIPERKNPGAVIEAFCRAFPPGAGPQLVIKSINGHADFVELERLRLLAVERPDVHVIDGYLDPGDQRALIDACDAYVSLHRAEGFGYTLAEAMLAGKPVIGTAYSGNLEFMDEANSFLVDFEMIPIPPSADPYPSTARWADADVEQAAELMRRIVEDPVGTALVAERGRRTIAEQHSPRARVPLLAARLAAIRASTEISAAPLAPSREGSSRLTARADGLLRYFSR